MPRETILFIHERYGCAGGAEQYILSIAQELCRDYNLVYLYSINTTIDTNKFDQVFSQRWQVGFDEPDAKIQHVLDTCLSQCKPDLVFFHKCVSISLIEGIVNQHIPTLRMVHDHEVYSMRTYRIFPWSRPITHKHTLLNRLGFLKSDPSQKFGVRWITYHTKQRLIRADKSLDQFIVGSRYMQSELLAQSYDASRINIIPPVSSRTSLSTPSGPKNDNIILFVGQVIRGKGLHYLIRALAHVQHPFYLIVLGDGPYLYSCQQLALRLGLLGRIEFKGFVSHDALEAYYLRATLVAVPSIWPEPFGMVGLEAMQHGLPVVAFDTGGISDWLVDGQNGYSVPWTNIAAMAEKLSLILKNHQEAERLGHNGYIMAQKRFAFDTTMNALRAIIKQTLRNQE